MQKSMIRLPRKQKASGNKERVSPSLARPLWNGCFSVSWGRTGLDLIPSLSLSLALSFRYCRLLSPSLRFGRRRSAPLPFPSPSLPPPRLPALQAQGAGSAASLGGVSAARAERAVRPGEAAGGASPSTRRRKKPGEGTASIPTQFSRGR